MSAARHAVLQHLQRMQEFIVEEFLALADIGLCRQHADGVIGQLIAAIVGFARPDRQHDTSGHAEFFLDARQRVAILHGKLPAARGKAVEARLAQILRRGLHEFRLLRSLLRLARNGEIGQRQVGFKPARRGIERSARDTHRLRRRPLRGQPLLEGSVGRLTGGRGREAKTRPQVARASCPHHSAATSHPRSGYPRIIGLRA